MENRNLRTEIISFYVYENLFKFNYIIYVCTVCSIWRICVFFLVLFSSIIQICSELNCDEKEECYENNITNSQGRKSCVINHVLCIKTIDDRCIFTILLLLLLLQSSAQNVVFHIYV